MSFRVRQVRDGIVYCLVHPTWPHLVKIGYTQRSVRERLRELNTEAVPGAFECFCAIRVQCPLFCEQLIHANLEEFRRTHEFFEVDPRIVKGIFGIVSSLVGGSFTTEFDTASMSRIIAEPVAEEPASSDPPASAAPELSNMNHLVDLIDTTLQGLQSTRERRRKNRLWTVSEETRVKQMAQNNTPFDFIAQELGRTRRAICIKLARLHEYDSFLTEQQLAECIDEYHTLPTRTRSQRA